MDESEMDLQRLHKLGPAVTVFGSARFMEGSKGCQLGVQVGRELVKAGFVVMTDGGPALA